MVENLYTTYKNFGMQDPINQAIEDAQNKLQYKMVSMDIDTIEGLALEAFAKYSPINVEKAIVLKGNKTSNWGTESPIYSYFWPRYEKYLLDEKNWGKDTVESIDSTTNEILNCIGNPQVDSDFDNRGLVLGYVQSGKTANFTGLINKAFDVGYKLVIVLAGMHNDLRTQTQLRLEKEVVGTTDSITSEKQGVARIKTGGTQIETWTTPQEDISSSNAIGIKNLDKPILAVVKKHKDVLPNLINLIRTSINMSNFNPATLIIDDEADQASIDTAGKTKPSTINKLIRELLSLFNKKAYVGYTATPFANLLINAEVNHREFGLDLYPKDFAISLPKPQKYCGPDEFFNTSGYMEDNKPVYIRHLSQKDIERLDEIKNSDDGALFKEVPPSMQEAILSFLMTIAIRNLRGQNNEHNSMLIHTSRFTDVQNSMCSVIDKFYKRLSNEILYNPESDYLNRLRVLYEEDILQVQSLHSSLGTQYQIYSFGEVFKEVRKIIGKVEVMEINGESDDALEYEKYKESGLNVIAIGGNKLSRGLTLDGLSISYYYRNSTMYDSLMQMGRWFGYREGYMDLCRIYTSKELAENFEHLAVVMSELREEFKKYKELDVTPEEYAAKMKDHSSMTVTSPTKMRAAEKTPNYSNSLQQTRIFDKNQSFFESNMKATIDLFENIGDQFIIKEDTTRYHIAKQVSSEFIIEFLKKYQTSSSASKVNSKKIANYIEDINNKGKFNKFNVAVVDVTTSTLNKPIVKSKNIKKFAVKIGPVSIDSAVLRSIEQDKGKNNKIVDLGAIVASNQEFVDIDGSSTNKIKNKELRNNENPLLMIYPLHPKVEPFKKLNIDFSENFVPIGIALSFPDIDIDPESSEDRASRKNGYVHNRTVGRNE
ncbi:Z1 domain-containing protein [Terribacillus saccharophilus]|uniref:Z1 domain-containing protein n=1 Tax=Terribacillus saccharophilus TaxID=361277 RepID=UPI00068B4AA7|nr:Z1 domain-containing protein [Terribacillus goriensis]